MRHAQAEDYAPGGDAERALTEYGRAQAVAVGTMLRRIALLPTVLCCSPLRRARQTIETVATAAEVQGPPITTEPRLVPGTSPPKVIAAVIAAAAAHSGPAVVLAVGHNPSVSATIATLLESPETMSIGASTADLAHFRLFVDHEPVRARLLAYLPAAAVLKLC